MDLWSKGLGRMVLGVRLSDRSELRAEDDEIVIRGTMGAPVYWGYAVRMGSEDVIDFIELLKQPAALGFVVTSQSRWKILGAALRSAVVFAWAIATRVVAGSLRGTRAAASESPPTQGDVVRQEEEHNA
jgi:hypothetical protein